MTDPPKTGSDPNGSCSSFQSQPVNKPFDFDQYLADLLDPRCDKQSLALRLWEYQRNHNPVVAEYMDRLQLPGPLSLPIAFFKSFALKTGGEWLPELIFESSGTTGQIPSRHWVKDAALYRQVSLLGFRERFGEGQFRILALLPSYLERGNSSLVYMVQSWIEAFGLPGSGFFLHDLDALAAAIREAAALEHPILLMGVSYALLDLAARGDVQLPASALVIETGGMKGRREELTRAQLHQELQQGLGCHNIQSEYGMTELLSQAYTVDGFRFRPSSTLLVRISDLHLDRLDVPPGRAGRIQLVDLANVHSCAFIATDDLGRMHPDGTFEVLGRIDNAELRGCNLMYL